MHQTKPREIAANILHQRDQTSSYTEDILNESLTGTSLKNADRRLVHELVLGIVRWQATLDWLVDRKTDGRPQKPLLRTLLRLGLYQMFWLDRVPSYAAVNESVAMARQFGFGPQSGFVNAILRAYSREREATQSLLAHLRTDQPWLGYSHPRWLCERWTARWGAESTAQLMAWNNGPAGSFARINSLRVGTPELLRVWDQEKVKYLPRFWDWSGKNLVFELLEHPPLDSLTSFQNGWFYIQDPSTILAVTLLNPQPGDAVLDACAAPGGKTTLMAQFMNNQGHVLAEDVDPNRLKLTADNCRRLGTVIVHVAEAKDLTAQTQEPVADHRLFQRALVDVPCSNTGVMRRRVDLRWRLRPAELERLVLLQTRLLNRTAQRVRKGGIMVYSTCSLEPEENEQRVRTFLDQNPGFILEKERQLIPFADNVDGAYAARFRRQH